MRLPAVEFVGILLAGVVEVEAEVGVDADAKIIVHDEHLRVVLVGYGRDVGHAAGLVLALLFRMEHHCPPIQSDLVGFDYVTQQVQRILAARVS